MQIFVSWSGDLSKQVADALCAWLPSVIQSTKTYYTPNDTEKGTRWFEEIAQHLGSSAFGIVVLTKDNLDRPWIHFEAGALISKLDRKVSPLLVNIRETELRPPLSLLNATNFEKRDFRKLLGDINAATGDKQITPETLDKIFEKFWPDLETTVNQLISRPSTSAQASAPKRTQQDVLEELVMLVRDLQRTHTGANGPSLTSISRKLVNAFILITANVKDDIDREECLTILLRLSNEFARVIDRADFGEGKRTVLEQLETLKQTIAYAKKEIAF